MNTTDKTIESSLEHLSEVVSLRTDEKAAHRDALQAFMNKNPLPAHVPTAWFMGRGVQFATAFLLVLMVGGGGIVSAETSMPGDPLYSAKLRITEPARSALILDPEEKTAFAIERADRRLKEFAVYAASETTTPETTSLITSALSESIAEVSEDVSEYTKNGDADSALKANADLQSILAAHSEVLDTLEEQRPEVEGELDSVSASVDAGIAATENVERDIVDALTPTLDSDAPVTEQAAEIEEALASLRVEVATETTSLDSMDRESITSELAAIGEIVGEASEARGVGNRKEALLLYTEADQRLSRLQTLIEADRSLGIGVTNESVK